MPQVDLDFDALAQLRLEARKDNDDLSACVRRLIQHANAKKPRKRGHLEYIPDTLSPNSLKEEYPTAILRFMCLLGWLAKKHGEDFEMALYYRGRGSRVLIARSPTPILESGNSTFPKQIPESSYWVCTNLSNKSKAQVVDGVMTILNYPAPERRTWVECMDTEESERGDSYSAPQNQIEDDDNLRI